MKTVKIQLKGFAAGIYNSHAAMWSFASKVDTTKAVPGKCVGQVKQLNDFMTCRESFIDFFRQQTRVRRNEIRLKDHPSYSNLITDTEDNPVELDATRILVGFHPSKEASNKQKELTRRFDDMKNSLRIANIVEKELGWTKTKLYKGDLIPATGDKRFPKMDKDTDEALERTAIYMFIGSKKYMFAPHMLSLYLLFLRLGMNANYAKVKDLESLMQAAKRHVRAGNSDASFVKSSYLYWTMFLKNWRDLYKSRYLLTNYSYDIVPSSEASVEGIDKLCNGNCKDEALLTRFRALKAKKKDDINDLVKMAEG